MTDGKKNSLGTSAREGTLVGLNAKSAEALLVEGKHFVDCIKNNKAPVSDGEFGFRMVELIEAATASMRGRGETIHLPKKSK